MPNQLVNEPSLYLKQHCNQPVDWYPWGEAAFSLAHKMDKPVLISIGYSACHWCNKMSAESFSDSYIASIMNRHFVCIKVDREERPDIDQTYLEAIHMFNQSAGWPLHAFCLPDGRPFWGGTYFPKEDNDHGIAPWPQVLMRISEHYKRKKEELIENAKNVVGNLIHSNNANSSNDERWNNHQLLDSVKLICESYDEKNGGFSPAPKFPSPMKIDFLMAIRESQTVKNSKSISEKIDHSVQNTLLKMARGGIQDHIEGGFFRYSVDAEWRLPHFEKMLYDNALLISTYSKAYQTFSHPLFKEVVSNTISWVLSNMKDSEGGYYSSVHSDTSDGEGEYYFVKYKSLIDLIGEKKGTQIANFFGITPDGNVREGKSLPLRSENLDIEPKEIIEARKVILSLRQEKVKPLLDTKKITAWNALLVRGFTDAARAFNRKDWLDLAWDLNEWMNNNLLLNDQNVISIFYSEHEKSERSYLDDYAIWAESLLNLSSISDWNYSNSSTLLIKRANQLTKLAINKFKDEQASGFFFQKDEVISPATVRKKFWYDNAIPSGNSSLLRVFSTLFYLTGENSYLEEFQNMMNGFFKFSLSAPHGIGHALSSISENAIGISTCQYNSIDMDEIIKMIAKFPYRPLYLKKKSVEKNEKYSTLFVNEKELGKSLNPAELIKKIF